MPARIAEARALFGAATAEGVQDRFGWPRKAREAYQWKMASIEDQAAVSFDELGREVEAGFDQMLNALTNLCGETVEGSDEARLRAEIDDVREFKESVLKMWPWTYRPKSPIDWQMVAESRAAFARGEGIPIEDLIRELGGEVERLSVRGIGQCPRMSHRGSHSA